MNWHLASLVTLLLLLALGTEGVEGRRGQTASTRLTLPPEALAALLAAPPGGAFTAGWTLPAPLRLPAAGNPWRVELALEATPVADGDARALFYASWHGAGGADDDARTPVQPLRFGIADARAGSPLTTYRVGAPLSLREDREVRLELALAEHHNLALRQLSLTLWSGNPGASWREWLGSLRLLWIGLITAVLVHWQRQRRQA